jgi:hypothetical protein
LRACVAKRAVRTETAIKKRIHDESKLQSCAIPKV